MARSSKRGRTLTTTNASSDADGEHARQGGLGMAERLGPAFETTGGGLGT